MSLPNINRTREIAAALVLSVALLTGVSALAATCRISGGPDPLIFGALDPANAVNVTSLPGAMVLNCGDGLPYSISIDNGLSFAAGKRRLSSAAGFIPYTISNALPITGVGIGAGGPSSDIVIDLTGAINGTDYINAAPGTYSDTLVITVSF